MRNTSTRFNKIIKGKKNDYRGRAIIWYNLNGTCGNRKTRSVKHSGGAGIEEGRINKKIPVHSKDWQQAMETFNANTFVYAPVNFASLHVLVVY